ncbi:GNAT family N-acetyltransferase [Inhella proteolytica]|uniref:GNAT family N-acetyltransferase n=1 Tax=Inhella proteolytica TaxID=2795029 RepID=A0A931J5F1_9BURK|nr:GNAT family N-acetyltransferase [Inhella proteolytica]MBH9576510.1 GNAT family N-acetyltransferase [Inhella proteolytica]
MKRWNVYPLDRTLGTHAARWQALNERAFSNHPLLQADLVDELLRRFGEGNEHLCECVEDGSPVAMAILRPKGRLTWTSFQPSQSQIGLNLVRHAADAQALFKALPWAVAQIDLLCQDPLLTDNEGLLEPLGHVQNHARTAWIDLEGSWEQYLAGRSKNLRANLRRYEHRLEAEGLPARFVCHTEASDVRDGVLRYAELEGRGWKAAAGTALGSFDAQLAFYTSLLEHAAARGQARVYELYLGDQLAASRLTITNRDTLVVLKTSYEESLGRLAPGRLHLLRLLQEEFTAQQFKRIELYTNATADTAAWCTGTRWIRHLSLLRGATPSLLFDGLAQLRRGRWRPPSDDLQVHQVSRLDDLPAAARSLLDAQSSAGSCLGSPWFGLLESKVFSAPDTTRYAWLERNDTVLAVLPLLLHRPRWGAVQIQGLANYYSSLYAPAVHPELQPSQLAHLLEQTLQSLPRAGALRFEPLAIDSLGAAQLRSALRLLKWPSFQFACASNWTLVAPPDWEHYLASRSGALRSTLRRKAAKLKVAGGHLQVVQTEQELEPALQDYLSIYARSWKRPEPYPEFIPSLMRAAAARGELRLGLVYLDRQAIAAQLWLVHKDRAEIHKLAHDEAAAAYSPGSLLTAHLLQHVFEQDGVQLVDFLTGDDAYKANWMDHCEARWGLLSYNPRRLSGLLGAVREGLALVTRPWRRTLHQALRLRSAPPPSDPKSPQTL